MTILILLFDTELYLILITDSPDKPEGPLEVGNITPDSCVLTWNAPKVSVMLYFAMYMFHSVAIGKNLSEKKTQEKPQEKNFDSHLISTKNFIFFLLGIIHWLYSSLTLLFLK